MKVELLVSEWCPTCPAAEAVWRTVARERDIQFAVLDLVQPEARELAQRLRLKTVPAVVVNGALAGVGVQTLDEARKLVERARLRASSSPLHAGMTLSTDNRCFVSGAMIHLMLSAAWLLWQGALITEGALRVVGVLLFVIGFVLPLIYGLAAHMLPRFTGNPIAMGGWPWIQFISMNSGLWLFVAGTWASARSVALTGAVLLWLSLIVFAWRVWYVLWPRQDSLRQVSRWNSRPGSSSM